MMIKCEKNKIISRERREEAKEKNGNRKRTRGMKTCALFSALLTL